MKVVLKDDLSPTSKEYRWLKRGKEYAVLSIEQSSTAMEYRISSEMDMFPGLFDSTLFNVVDGSIPSTWISSPTDFGVEQAPASWMAPGFWDRVFDDDPEALRIFREEREKIEG